MAYLNEFPHVEGSALNLDWILEQYSTFNQRLQEITDAFNEAVQTMEADISTLENNYRRELDNFESRILNEVQTMSNKVDSINENIGGYVNNYLTENITQILQTNPVLEVKFEKIGYIDTNETCTLELEEDKIYEIMTIDYALNMHRGLAVNNATRITESPHDMIEVIYSAELEALEPEGYDLRTTQAPVKYFEDLISLSAASNVLTITNLGTNRIRVYAKIIGEL